MAQMNIEPGKHPSYYSQSIWTPVAGHMEAVTIWEWHKRRITNYYIKLIIHGWIDIRAKNPNARRG